MMRLTSSGIFELQRDGMNHRTLGILQPLLLTPIQFSLRLSAQRLENLVESLTFGMTNISVC